MRNLLMLLISFAIYLFSPSLHAVAEFSKCEVELEITAVLEANAQEGTKSPAKALMAFAAKIEKKRPLAAAHVMDRVLAMYPTNTDALYAGVDLFLRTEQFDKALEFSEIALERDPLNSRMKINKYKAMIGLKEYVLASSQIEREAGLRALQIDHLRALVQIGMVNDRITVINKSVDEDDRANGLIDLAEKLKSADPEVRLFLANRLISFPKTLDYGLIYKALAEAELNQLDEALVTLDHVLHFDQRVKSLMTRAQILYVQARYPEALETLSSIISQNPKDHIAYGFRAQIHLMMENYRDALVAADTKIRLAPDDYRGYLVKLKILLRMNKKYLSIPVAYDLARLDPQNKLALRILKRKNIEPPAPGTPKATEGSDLFHFLPKIELGLSVTDQEVDALLETIRNPEDEN